MIDFELSPESSDELTIQELLAQHVGGDRTVEWFGRRKGGGTFPMSFGLSDVQLGDERAPRQPPRQGVLPAPSTDDEDLHVPLTRRAGSVRGRGPR